MNQKLLMIDKIFKLGLLPLNRYEFTKKQLVEYTEKYKPILKQAKVIVIDDAVSYFYNCTNQKDTWLPKDFPKLILHNPYIWMEFRTKDLKLDISENKLPYAVGALIETRSQTDLVRNLILDYENLSKIDTESIVSRYQELEKSGEVAKLLEKISKNNGQMDFDNYNPLEQEIVTLAISMENIQDAEYKLNSAESLMRNLKKRKIRSIVNIKSFCSFDKDSVSGPISELEFPINTSGSAYSDIKWRTASIMNEKEVAATKSLSLCFLFAITCMNNGGILEQIKRNDGYWTAFAKQYKIRIKPNRLNIDNFRHTIRHTISSKVSVNGLKYELLKFNQEVDTLCQSAN